MNTEPTQEQVLRGKLMACGMCSTGIPVGANYPPAIPLPRTLELWCGACKVITLHINPLYTGK